MLLRLGERFPFLCFVYDGVAPEHGVCAVAGYLHGDSLGNASHNHVAGSCAAKIVKLLMVYVGFFAGSRACLAEISDWLAVAVKNELSKVG